VSLPLLKYTRAVLLIGSGGIAVQRDAVNLKLATTPEGNTSRANATASIVERFGGAAG